MNFNVGDKVRALPNNRYAITTNGWVGYVTRVTANPTWIYVSENINGRASGAEEWSVNPRYFELATPAPVKEKEEKTMVKVSEIINDEERRVLLNDMKGILDEYDYQYTEEALNKIIDEWATNKADLITAFKKHPNYLNGKFMIVFSHNFDRNTDKSAIIGFKKWLLSYDVCYAAREFMPEEMRNEVIDYGRKLPNDIFCFFADMQNMTEQYIDDYIVDRLNNCCPNIHAHKGQKMSRVINKLCTYVGFNKLPDYNRAFAKYADALNPLQITRHTVLSVNPLDYLTMSFGNSWASCHTIDKANKRGMPNSYEGMYSSGTVSYMLDKPSMVFYTVDASYNGNDFWHEPKINRQMFHWGEEKLVQGRLYPQDNDGDNSVYTPYREIVQNIMSELFNFPNLWTVSKGTDAAGRYVCSYGTHYRDYDSYDNCTLSRIKGSENEQYIDVGHNPICIKCGDEHNREDNISCCAKKVECTHCGCEIDEDDARYIDGNPYCDDCTFWCDCCDEWCVGDSIEVRGGLTVCRDCLDDNYTRCSDCDEYVRNRFVISIDGDYVCSSCLAANFGTCDGCGEIHRFTDMREFAHRTLCSSCVEIAKNETESEAV